MQKKTKKIQIELTSHQGSNWTWRKVGAKQPKGELAARLLPKGAKLGDEIWVEVTTDLDGVSVQSVLPPAKDQESKNGSETLELLSSEKKFQTVNVLYADGSPRNIFKKKKAKRKKRKEESKLEDSKVEKKNLGPKLKPKYINRDAWLKNLPEDKQPIAQELIKGGLPAVRSAIEKDKKIKSGEGLLEVAEKLLPDFRLMEWRDRCAAALEEVEKIRLADLRSVLASAEGLLRHEDVQKLSDELRQKLMERLEKEHKEWLGDINTLLDEGRIVRALNISSRPPKAGSPLPEELAWRLTTLTNESLTSEISTKRWISFLEAINRSPVAQQVEPVSVPENPPTELLEMLQRIQNYIPKIVQRFQSGEQKTQQADQTTNQPVSNAG